jgi:hypothetical protein
MHYVSWTETFNEVASSWSADNLGAEEIFGAANADDLSARVRFGETGLRGRFPFLGKDRYEMLVNSNGWIQFDNTNTLPCQYIYRYIRGHSDTFPIYSCFQTGYSNGKYSKNLNTTYYGGIGVYLTDLYPTYNYPTANIKWSNTSEGDGIIVHWIKNPFFEKNLRNESQITVHSRLKSDGQVSIYWESLDGFTQSECEEYRICETDNMIAGIRDSVRSDQESFLTTTTAQDHTALNTWYTLVKGVYPARGISEMQAGRLYHMCPFSDSWTLSPNYAKQYGSATNVTFYAMYTSCASQFASYKCTFTRVSDSTTSHAPAHYYKGNYTDQWYTYYPSYVCEVPNAVLNADLGEYTVDLFGVFSVAVQTDAGSVTELSLLPETDIASRSFSLRLEQGNRSLDANNDCAVSAALATSVGSSGACYPCSMRWNVTTCMFKQSSCPTSMLAPADCRGQCPAASGAVGVPYLYDTVTLISYDWSDRSFLYKHTSTCCNTSVIDCAGECNGGRHIAPTLTAEATGRDGRALMDNRCCSPLMLTPDRTGCCLNNPPDCAGKCGGNATVDCLGYCQVWHSNGTWNDCAGICGGNSFENACGDCYNQSYSGAVPGLNNSGICRAVLEVTNPDPYLDITTADRNSVENMVHLNASEFDQQIDTYIFLSKIDLSYTQKGEQDGLIVTIPLKNERPFALNVSLRQDYADYRSKFPTLSHPSGDIILPVNSTTTIEVTVDASYVYNRPVKMTSNTKSLWGIKPLTIESRPVLHDGMITTRNIENYTIVIFPVTTDCDAIATFEDCSYAPKCIYCSTSDPGRSLRETTDEDKVQQRRSLYLTYTTSLRPVGKPRADLGGFCTSGFMQERCDSLLLGMGYGEVNPEAMKWWLPTFFLIVLAFGGILRWLATLDDSKIWS